jgi:hypothetical protein
VRWSGVQRFDGCANVGALREHAKAGGVQWYGGAAPRASVERGFVESCRWAYTPQGVIATGVVIRGSVVLQDN